MDHYDDEHSSWQDDLRVDRVNNFLSELLSSAGVAEVDMPHIVVCRDDESESVSYSGPFPDGLTALVFAERETELDRRLNDGDPLTFSVAALYPAEHNAPD
jgi:hypothetical protein